MKIGNETIEQIKVCEFLRSNKIPFYHFVNEGKRGYQNAAILKKMGMTAGVSDLFLPRGNAALSGLWLEMKAKGGRLSDAQKKFQADMADENYATHVAYSAEEAILIIKTFYGIR